MKTNIGAMERVFRAIVGLAIIAAAIYYQSWWGLVGLEISLTGVIGWSPLYRLFNISTFSPKTHQGYAA